MTVEAEYQVAKLGTGDFGKRRSLQETIKFLRTKIPAPNTIHLREVGNDQGPARTRLDAFQRAERKLADAEPGYKLSLLVNTGPHSWTIRVLREQNPVADTPGTDPIDQIVGWVFGEYGEQYKVYDLGICANKPGQHYRCNAWDGGVGKPQSADDIHAGILDVANGLRIKMLQDLQGEPTGLPILGIIVMEQVCSRDQPYWTRYYGTPHVSHWHVSGSPSQYSGWI